MAAPYYAGPRGLGPHTQKGSQTQIRTACLRPRPAGGLAPPLRACRTRNRWKPANNTIQASPVAVSGSIELKLEFSTIDALYHQDSFYELTFNFVCPTESPTPAAS